MTPTTVAFTAGPLVRIVTESPTPSFPCFAVTSSSGTSPSAVGARPSVSRSGERPGVSDQSVPNVGTFGVPRALPSLPRTWTPGLKTAPSAACTPGISATFPTRFSGTVRPPATGSPEPTSSTGWIVTSELTWSNRSRNVLPSVSVNTSVPATNATPRTTASPLRTRRSLCASRFFTVTRNIRRPVRPSRTPSSGRGHARASVPSSRRRCSRRRGTARGRRTTRRRGRA